MRIHFIAIGGSAMHNLAIALHKKGHTVTGSDDEIFEPSRSRLDKYGLLPKSFGWKPGTINTNIDAIILGMHAREDNPELLKAQEIGVKIYSYPEYLYEQTKDKTRVVIGGSHGKTTTTSMVMHVLKYHNIAFDYMVGAKIEGFETMVGLSDTSKLAIFEGDEYLSSPIDRRPKFHHYYPHVAMLTGIAWDHINVFPTFEGYVEQFEIFAQKIDKNGSLVYFKKDEHLEKIASKLSDKIKLKAYNTPRAEIIDGVTYLITPKTRIPLNVFGDHNLQNLEGARLVCNQIDINDEMFYDAIQSFGGSARRLEKVAEDENTTIFYDFAHSPSKLKATVSAVKQQYPNRKLIAIMELHTFSSLKVDFLPQYKGSMDAADEAFVYFNPATIAHKKLKPITSEMVLEGFGGDISIYTKSANLFQLLKEKDLSNSNILIMSSGNFSGVDIKGMALELTNK